jgi:hypothetical protein
MYCHGAIMGYYSKMASNWWLFVIKFVYLLHSYEKVQQMFFVSLFTALDFICLFGSRVLLFYSRVSSREEMSFLLFLSQSLSLSLCLSARSCVNVCLS